MANFIIRSCISLVVNGTTENKFLDNELPVYVKKVIVVQNGVKILFRCGSLEQFIINSRVENYIEGLEYA